MDREWSPKTSAVRSGKTSRILSPRYGLVVLGLLLVTASFQVSALHAKDMSNLYDRGTLRTWRQRYSKTIPLAFFHDLFPFLYAAEKQAAAGVRLYFPLVGEVDGDPLEFYSVASPPVITVPVLSVKFFDDIAVGYAWLEENGYSTHTVIDYIGLLKYSDPSRFSAGHPPPPWEALQIPSDVLKDKTVDELSQKILKSGLSWILLHELGHVRYGHAGYDQVASVAQAVREEEQADEFATEIMRRVGVAPIGVAHFMAVATYWWPNRGDYDTQRRWEDYLRRAMHPLTGDRLEKLGKSILSGRFDFIRKEPNAQKALLAVNKSAYHIIALARFLRDDKLQYAFRRRVKRIRLSELKPTRSIPPDAFRPEDLL